MGANVSKIVTYTWCIIPIRLVPIAGIAFLPHGTIAAAFSDLFSDRPLCSLRTAKMPTQRADIVSETWLRSTRICTR